MLTPLGRWRSCPGQEQQDARGSSQPVNPARPFRHPSTVCVSFDEVTIWLFSLGGSMLELESPLRPGAWRHEALSSSASCWSRAARCGYCNEGVGVLVPGHALRQARRRAYPSSVRESPAVHGRGESAFGATT